MKDCANFFNKLKPLKNKRKIILLLVDALIFVFADLLYYLLTFLSSVKGVYAGNGKLFFFNSVLLFFAIMITRFVFKTYSNVWRYTDTRAYFLLVVSDFASGFISVGIAWIASLISEKIYLDIWHAFAIVSLCAIGTMMSRFTYRLLYKRFSGSKQESNIEARTPIAIIGAGHMGAYLANELLNSNKSKYSPRCFIDCDEAKIGNRVAGLPVVGSYEVESAISKYGFSDVVVAVTNLDSDKYEKIWTFYSKLGCKVKIYDSAVDEREPWAKKDKKVIRDFSIEDLLFRKPLNVGNEAEFEYYSGKCILVTGGGGSIGSELCRQIASCRPQKLIIFDIYENNAYDIQQELIRKYGENLDLYVEIGSVRDVARLECIFKNHKPDIVFHAAAHKHVPLMERSGCEAIKNNVLGTYNTANMAEKYGVEKFILISTDKAVNPTNIMGASKRLCEMVIQCRTDSATNFAAVRFGNVLGSNGSVIPLFKRQILAGGPVTITDKRIIRYFMTIPEASRLVMSAGAKAQKGELFVLDMGQPVRIYDLAVNMIKLMGYVPGEDIAIEEIGLRPGEKLYEELLMKNEELIETDNKMIFVEKDKPYSRAEVEEKLDILKSAVLVSCDDIASPAIKEAIKQTVPTFIDPDEANAGAALTEEMKNVKREFASV